MVVTVLWYALLAGLPCAALSTTLFNLATWSRGSPEDALEGTVSVLVPARNEEDDIETCVRRIAENSPTPDEILVYDDRSTDRTPEILEELQEEYPMLRRLSGAPLPEGWVGKPRACHQLAEAARGDVLVFVDADTFLREDGLARLLSLLTGDDARSPADLATAVPRQVFEGTISRLVLPLLHVTYTSWLPMRLIRWSDDPRFLAANGQLVAVRREALRDVGGFEAIRDAIVDDMALARRFKESGRTVEFGDGFEIADCCMYRSGSELWEGFSKNLYEGLGSSFALIGAVGLYLTAFVVPYVALAAGLVPDTPALWWQAGAVGVGANLALRFAVALRFDHPIESVLVHPLAVLGLVAIALNSWRWHLRGSISWGGRSYDRKSER
jgi:chlorobactene glucosyltransferase